QQVVGDRAVRVHDARKSLRVRRPRARAVQDTRQRVEDVPFLVVGLEGRRDGQGGIDARDADQGQRRQRESEDAECAGSSVDPRLFHRGDRSVLARRALLSAYFSIIQRYAYCSAETRAVSLLTAPLPWPPSVFSK